ncbi:MAG: hypothetical protein WBL45_07465 [Solirubrobacterales bacterium]
MTFLGAAERAPNRAVFLRLQSSRPPFLEEDGGGDFLAVGLEERREQMYIKRGVGFDEPIAMVTASPLGAEPFNVNVVASNPFSGTGAYSQAPGSPASWSGDLSVSLPGARDVPLTGPGFSAVACGDNERTNRREICEGEIEELYQASLLRPRL